MNTSHILGIIVIILAVGSVALVYKQSPRSQMMASVTLAVSVIVVAVGLIVSNNSSTNSEGFVRSDGVCGSSYEVRKAGGIGPNGQSMVPPTGQHKQVPVGPGGQHQLGPGGQHQLGPGGQHQLGPGGTQQHKKENYSSGSLGQQLKESGWAFVGVEWCGYCTKQKEIIKNHPEHELDIIVMEVDAVPAEHKSKLTAFPAWLNLQSGEVQLGLKNIQQIQDLV
jgi:hypothetical protein